MEGRRLLVAMVVSMGVFILWMAVAPRFWPQPTSQPTSATGQSGEGGKTPDATGSSGIPSPMTASAPTTGTAPTAASAPGPATATSGSEGRRPLAAAGDLKVDGAFTGQTWELGSVDPAKQYPMRIILTNRGAAIESIRLRDYKQTVAGVEPYALIDPVTDPRRGDRRFYSYATEKIRIEPLGQDVMLDEMLWKLDRDASTDGKAVFRVTIDARSRPMLEVTKTYTLEPVGPMPPRGQETNESLRHDMSLSYEFRSLLPEPFDVILVQQGPEGIHQEDPRTDWRRVISAMSEDGEIKLNKKEMNKQIAGDKVVEIGADKDAVTLAWAALTNKYFVCLTRPVREPGSPLRIARAEALSSTGSPDTSFGDDMTYHLVTAPIRVPANGGCSVAFECYLGPKSKVAFERIEEYSRYNYFAVIAADFYCCAPAPVVRAMMWLLQKLYWPTHNYGVAIILLVLVVRIVLHPVTKAGQVNMMKMQKMTSALQPKLEEAKSKFPNDKQRQNQEVMRVYREAGVNPASQMLGCLPMALQVPIWAGLWAALGATIEMRHAPFDGYWIKDLAAPDNLIPFGHSFTLPILSDFLAVGPIHGFNLLPILLSITMWLQQKYTPKTTPPGASSSSGPDQLAMQQKMMSFMTVFFGIMLYNAPSGLTLYIMASNVGAIVEQWRIRKHVRVLEERAKNAPPGSQTGWLGRLRKPKFLERLEEMADEARRVKSERDKDRR